MKYLLFLFLVFTSCSSRLDEALRLAGENRAELEKVLVHYTNDEQKCQAAVFLIENMLGHRSYRPEKIADFKHEYERIIFDERLPDEQKKAALEDLSRLYDLRKYEEEDVRLVTADFLIKSIDQSFDVWRNKPYGKHLSFEEFCEYILPYKVIDLQELDDWKRQLGAAFDERWEQLPQDDIVHDNTFNAAENLSSWIYSRPGLNYIIDYVGHNLHNAMTLEMPKFGQCLDLSLSAVAFMRSNGIPACVESIPQWGRKLGWHSWYSILNRNGTWLPSPWNNTSTPGTTFMPDKHLPKIYRKTYAADPDFKKYRHGSKLKLFSEFTKDVTDLYIRTSDLNIPVKRHGLKESYAYLAVFKDYSEWVVVAPGRMKWGKAHFDKVGRGIAYIVLGFDGEKLVPISMPFILEDSGEIRFCVPVMSDLSTVRLLRKYPRNANTAIMEDFVVGGQIQAACKPDFSDADTLYVIKNLDYPDMIPINSAGKYQYWRFFQGGQERVCTLAELQFLEAGAARKALTGTWIGPEEDQWHIKDAEKLCDGNSLTSYFSVKQPGSWVGLDFGQPVSVVGVRVVPRSDGNGVQYGDKYELKYWANSGWVSLGEQVAHERFVTYDGVPAGALLLLSNNTHGTEERIFTLENGKVRWW